MIFLDTGFLFAYMSEEDEKHDRVCEVMDSYQIFAGLFGRSIKRRPTRSGRPSPT